MSSFRWRRFAAIIIICALSFYVALLSYHAYYGHRRSRYRKIAGTKTGVSRLALETVVRALSGEKPLRMPKEGVRSLFQWIVTKEYEETFLKHGTIPERMIDRSDATFRDLWGRELIYKFPSRGREAIFDLYSVGPNGVDEMGKGDDITSAGMADFAEWSEEFKDGLIDLEWVRANLDHLERDPVDGKIVGAPKHSASGKPN